eukprot:scpid84519/ scgid4673/ 
MSVALEEHCQGKDPPKLRPDSEYRCSCTSLHCVFELTSSATAQTTRQYRTDRTDAVAARKACEVKEVDVRQEERELLHHQHYHPVIQSVLLSPVNGVVSFHICLTTPNSNFLR